MKRIIQPPKKKIVLCPVCECVFSCESEDIKYGNQRDYYEIVTCPCCGAEIDILRQES